ncbi:MAG: outer membrane lipoprotein carrier protein LolA [Amylibacter sp.]|nr:outer membrane lipoprotein carrier protein LolA [Amylibacter sp.]
MTYPSFAEKISLGNISDYINGLKMVEADFEQVNSDGSIDTGKLYIRRPGKMRLEYEAPNNALVIAGAGSVAIFDEYFNLKHYFNNSFYYFHVMSYVISYNF